MYFRIEREEVSRHRLVPRVKGLLCPFINLQTQAYFTEPHIEQSFQSPCYSAKYGTLSFLRGFVQNSPLCKVLLQDRFVRNTRGSCINRKSHTVQYLNNPGKCPLWGINRVPMQDKCLCMYTIVGPSIHTREGNCRRKVVRGQGSLASEARRGAAGSVL